MRIFEYLIIGICIFVVLYLVKLKSDIYSEKEKENQRLQNTVDSLIIKLKECDSCYRWNYQELEYLYNQRKK